MWEKREEFGKAFTYFIFALWSASEVLFNSTIETIFRIDARELNTIIDYIILVLLMVQVILFQRYKKEELFFVAAITVLVAFVTINSNYNAIMSTWIFIVVAKKIDFDTIVRLIYVIEVAMLLIVIYLFFSGYITENMIHRGYDLRHSLGFSHPNSLGSRIFQIIICRSYIRKEKFNAIDYVVILGAAIFIYLVPNSKTSFYLLIILAIFFLLYKVAEVTGRYINALSNIFIFISICANIFSIALSMIDVRRYPFLEIIDKHMSTRFSQCYRTISYYGIKMWGQNVQLIFSNAVTGRLYHFWLDNAYVALLLRYGVVEFLIFSFFYIYTMVFLKKIGQHYLVGILCLYAIYGMMENNFFLISQNLFLLVLSYPIFRMDMIENNIRRKIVINW